MLNEEGVCEDSCANRSFSGVTHLDSAGLSRADGHGLLLYIEAAAAHTRGRNRNATFNSRAFYPYAAPLLRELRTLHSTACKKRSLRLNIFCAPRLRRKPLITASEKNLPEPNDFFFDPSDKKDPFAARAKIDPHRDVHGAGKPFSLGAGMIPPAQVAQKSPPPYTPKGSRRLGKRVSTRLSTLSFWPALRTSSQKKRCPSSPHSN